MKLVPCKIIKILSLKNLITFLLFALITSSNICAQKWETYFSGSGYEFDTLIRNSANAIISDIKGNIWFGTDSGAFMFNGKDLQHYSQVSTNNGLASDTIYSVYPDSSGNIWFGTNKGISILNNATWVNYNKTNTKGLIPCDTVTSIVADLNKNIWVGTNLGLAKFDGINWVRYDSANTKGILRIHKSCCLAVDKKNNIWLGTYHQQQEPCISPKQPQYPNLYKFSNQKWDTIGIYSKYPANDDVFSIMADKYGNIWFGTHTAILNFNQVSWASAYNVNDWNCINYNRITAFTCDTFGNIFTSVSGYSYIVRRLGNELSFGSSSLPAGYILYVDTKNNFWIGGHATQSWIPDVTGKIQKVLSFANQYNNISDEHIFNAISADSTGNIWVASMTPPLLTKFDGKNSTNYSYANTNKGLINDTITALATDAKGKIWIGTYVGISVFDNEKWVSYTNKNTNGGLVDNYINSIAIDKYGKKWFGTNKGVSVFNDTNWINYTYKNTSGGLGGDKIIKIYCDSVNTWFALKDTGVSVFNGNKWIRYTINNTKGGLLNNNISSIATDWHGNTYFGYYDFNVGLSKFNGKVWANYTYENTSGGLLYNNITTLRVDNYGILWIAGNNGINRFDGTNWNVYNVNNDVWLQGFYSCTKSKDGNIWFGTFIGLVAMHPLDTMYYLNISNNKFHVGKDSSTITFNITSNTKWFLKYYGLKTDKDSGIGNGSVTVYLSPNPLDTIRDNIINVTALGVTGQFVTISQEPANLGVSVNDIYVSWDSSIARFDIRWKSDWKLEIKYDSTWTIWKPKVQFPPTIKADKTSGFGSQTVTLYIPHNPKDSVRFAYIIVTPDSGSSRTVTIRQAMGNPYLKLSANLISIGKDSASVSFQILSNAGWFINRDLEINWPGWYNNPVETNKDWGKGNDTIFLEIPENNTGLNRYIIFDVYSDEWDVPIQKVKIIQYADTLIHNDSTFLSVSKDSIQVFRDSCTASFEITANITWTLSITYNNTWAIWKPQEIWPPDIKANDYSGIGDETIFLSIPENPKDSVRFAYVNINGTDAIERTFEKIIKVIQFPFEKTGIADKENSFEIFPNPVRNKLYIKIISPKSEVMIFDLNGKLLINIKNAEWIDVGNLSRGIYILKAVEGDDIIYRKIVKE